MSDKTCVRECAKYIRMLSLMLRSCYLIKFLDYSS